MLTPTHILTSNATMTIADYVSAATVGTLPPHIEKIRVHRRDGRPLDVTSDGTAIMEADCWGKWTRERCRAGWRYSLVVGVDTVVSTFVVAV